MIEIIRIILIQLAGTFMGILLVSICGYVENFKVSRGSLNLIKYWKITTKKIIYSSIENKMSKNTYLIKYLIYLMFSGFIMGTIYSGGNVERYTFLLLSILYFVIDVLIFIEEKTLVKIINEYIGKKIGLLTLVIASYIFSINVLVLIQEGTFLSILMKIVIFLNTASLLYLNEFLFKGNSEVLDKYYKKILFYFLLMSLFISLNSFGSTPQSFVKYGYFSISIILIEFMATYVKTNIGYLKLKSSLKLVTNNLFIYLITFISLFLGATYVF